MSEMEIAILKTKLAIYEQKRLQDAMTITLFGNAIQSKDAKIIEQQDKLKSGEVALAKKQEELKALHDVWWYAYNLFPEGWEDVMGHLIDDKGVIDIETAKIYAEILRTTKRVLVEEK